MILIQNQKHLYTRKDSLKSTLKYMLPYMLVDIFLILLIQWPQSWMGNVRNAPWIKAIGLFPAWLILPPTLQLDDVTVIVADPAPILPSLVLKSLVFFVIYIQLRIITSTEYERFML